MPSAPPPAARPGSRRWTIAVLATALVVRGAALLLVPDALVGDPDSYRRLAENVLQYGCFGNGLTSTAYRPPLYPLTLVPCLALGGDARFAIGLLHLAMGVATVWLVDRLGRRWGRGNCAALAGLLVAVDPILLRQSTLVMTETMATLLACLALLALTWASERTSAWRASAAGASLGLAALCRPTFLAFAALAAILLPFLAFASETSNRSGATSGKPRAGRMRWPARLPSLSRLLRTTGAMAAGLALVLSPWAIRNQRELGRPIVGTSHGGYTLLLGNNPQFYEYLRSGPWGQAWDAEEFFADWQERLEHAAPADELAADGVAYDAARETIRRQPGMFVYSCLVRVGRLWLPLPHQVAASESAAGHLARYAVAVCYLLEFGMACVGIAVMLRGLLAKRSVGEYCPASNPSPPTHLPRGERGEREAPTAFTQGERGDSRQDQAADLPIPDPQLPTPVGPISNRTYSRLPTPNSLLPTLLWPLLLAASFTAVHCLYWSDMRMRAPLMPAVALAACLGTEWTISRLRQARES